MVKKLAKLALFLCGLLVFVVLLAAHSRLQTSEPVRGPVHWHAHLSFEVDGESIEIPAEVGVTSGLNVENEISGVEASPAHTHDETGVIHFEVDDYATHGDRVTLGYFFYVWQRPISDSCFLGYCTDSLHQVRFFVNGIERFDWKTYPLQDGDELVLAWIPLDLLQRARL